MIALIHAYSFVSYILNVHLLLIINFIFNVVFFHFQVYQEPLLAFGNMKDVVPSSEARGCPLEMFTEEI